MTDMIAIDDYLARGGMLTSPDNVPPRYRGELLRLMSSFVDSELAGSAGFAASINLSPGIKERIAASRITLEKADHANRVLDVMGAFGTDTVRYQSQHDWTTRLPRDADLGVPRTGVDMRLSVFHYPIEGWNDAVVMNVLMGLATCVQLAELSKVSYAPLADVFREVTPQEARHAELGLEGLERIVSTAAGEAEARASFAYWHPRVAATFGVAGSTRYDMLQRLGLRHTPNEALIEDWKRLVDARLHPFGLA